MITNAEGHSHFAISDSLYTFSSDGVCAMMRIGNEEEFIVPCLLAVRDFFDEFVIVYNNTTDRTRSLVEKLNFPNVTTYEYPFEIAFRGEAHIGTPLSSVHHSAYYYNWCLSKVKSKWVAKWDGDNIALPNFKATKDIIHKNECDAILNCAWDLTGSDMNMLGRQQQVGYETRFFRKGPSVKYVRNPNGFTQCLSSAKRIVKQIEPTFLHMKWTKKTPAMYWPLDWATSDHFRGIKERHNPTTRYRGVYPQVLMDYIINDRNPDSLIEMYSGNKDPVAEAQNYEH